MAENSSLDAATQDRKARLAQLKSLKRKQPPSDVAADQDLPISPSTSIPGPSTTVTHISGRNYDSETKGPKLGFDNAPTIGQLTLEEQARSLAETTREAALEEEKADRPLDLFKLQPKKPNWDLKRDLNRKLEVLNVRTDNAIAKLVRERIATTQREANNGRTVDANGDADMSGIDGTALIGAMHEREREAEMDRQDNIEDDI